MSIFNRLRGSFRRDRSDADLNAEIQSHVEMRERDNQNAGLPSREAREQAQKQFGSAAVIKEETRDADLVGWFDSVVKDLRYAARMLRRNPGFTAVAVLTLALGIGANTAMFTLLDQILLRSLPVKNPQALVALRMRGRHYGSNWGANAISYPMYRDFQDHNEVFSGMFARFAREVSLTYEGKSELTNAELVSGTYFDILGVSTILGRPITPNEDRTPDGEPYIVLAYDFWRQRFAADPNIVGKSLIINNQKLTVIGVAQPGFDGIELGRSTKLFVPLMMEKLILVDTDTPPKLQDRRTRWVNAFGRLKPGVSQQQAKVSLQPFMHSMLEMEVKEAAFSNASPYDREQFLKCWIDVLPGSQGRSNFRESLSTPLWVLMAATGVVLLISCANIANLLLARASGRQKEIAMRLAIGASRRRIIRQLLIETLSLSALGAIAGLIFAAWVVKALIAIYLPNNNGALSISSAPDLRILGFTLAVTILTGVFFGLVPALQTTRVDIGRTLKDQGGAVVGGGHAGMRKSLVVAQVALSFLLVLGAGLFLRTLNNLSSMSPGFPVSHLVGFELDPSLAGYSSDRAKSFYLQLTENLSAIPGVQSVGLATMRILEGDEWDSGMTVDGFTAAKAGQNPEPYMNEIGPNYFATLGIPIVAGRDFTMQDNREVRHSPRPDSWTPTAVMINETFAKKYLPGQNPIGHHVGFGIDPGTHTDMEIIGVVKDIRYTGLRDEIPEQAFIPYLGSRGVGSMVVYLRTASDPDKLTSTIREKVRELDPNLPVFGMRTMETQISNSLSSERMIASLSSVFGMFATILAAIGLYGVMAYTVSRRTREIGIRMALGAERGRVMWMVMRDVLLLIAVGVAIGVPASLGLTRYVKSQLYGVQPHDLATLLIAIVALATVASISGLIPAMRASRLDPMAALRHE
ncbi:MAG TPA: ABC transporter permease [Candidatus Acidoferrales bacterium]|nr:ABC transporter permease [Candidatus Acidoferrales bacterium]